MLEDGLTVQDGQVARGQEGLAPWGRKKYMANIIAFSGKWSHCYLGPSMEKPSI